MPHVDVIFTVDRDGPDGESVPDSLDFRHQLQAITGDEFGDAWRITSDGSAENGASISWRLRLDHDSDEVVAGVKARLISLDDPQIQLSSNDQPVAFEPLPDPPFTPAVVAPLQLPLPASAPAFLVRSEIVQQRVAAIVGLAAGILLSAAAGLLTPQGSALRQMFDPRVPTAAIPTAILCAFFWGVLHGLIRWRRLRAVRKLNSSDLAHAIVRALSTHGPAALAQALNVEFAYHDPLIQRIRLTLEQWLLRPSLQNANLALEQQVISDREATQRSYTIPRIFVWATPVLGLIGTVIGISIAVGGFAGFLSTDVDDVQKIKAALVGVTGGLSFAFLITLEGLLSSLILMLFTSAMQTGEERYYAGIDQIVAEGFLPELQRVSPEKESSANTELVAGLARIATTADQIAAAIATADTNAAARLEKNREDRTGALKAVCDAVHGSHHAIMSKLEGNHSEHIGALQAVATAVASAGRGIEQTLREGASKTPEDWSKEMKDAAERVLGVVDVAGQALLARWDERNKAYISDLTLTRETVETSARTVTTTLTVTGNEAATQLTQTVGAQKEVIEQVVNAAKESLRSSGAEVDQAIKGVVNSLNNVTSDLGSHIRSAVQAFAEAATAHRTVTQQAITESRNVLAGHATEIVRASEAVQGLAKATVQVLECQAALQVAVAQLGDARLTNLLSDLDSTLKDLKPLLANLSQPFVLQAVPMPNRGAAAVGGE